MKNTMKRFAMEFDISKVPRLFEILREETVKFSEMNGLPVSNNLKIEINSGQGDTSINIITQLPTPDQANIQAQELSNENTTEAILDVEPTQEK
jgi:hypothetical protein